EAAAAAAAAGSLINANRQQQQQPGTAAPVLVGRLQQQQQAAAAAAPGSSDAKELPQGRDRDAQQQQQQQQKLQGAVETQQGFPVEGLGTESNEAMAGAALFPGASPFASLLELASVGKFGVGVDGFAGVGPFGGPPGFLGAPSDSSGVLSQLMGAPQLAAASGGTAAAAANNAAAVAAAAGLGGAFPGAGAPAGTLGLLQLQQQPGAAHACMHACSLEAPQAPLHAQ
ncbi:hypothetical protein, conserved, partial [Eimeria tenella]